MTRRSAKSPARQTADARAWKIFRLRGAYAFFRGLRGAALPKTSEWNQANIICAAINDMLRRC